MSTYEWFLLIVVVIVVPLTVAVVVTLWTIDQANKRKRANRKDAQIGVKRKAALSPEEVEARKAARAKKQQDDGVMPMVGATDRDLTDDRPDSTSDSVEASDVTPDASPDAGASDAGSSDSGGSDGGGGGDS